MEQTAPLTLGTAGHVDHGKTTLVEALTGVDTDRLPEEKRRGLSIVLGYAPLARPGGRVVSIVDVPGHERFVRTMVAGATGVDLFLMTIAADDGVMPQTREHAAVLAALDVRTGVVAVTKCDRADPQTALEQAADLLPGVPAVACSARAGTGLDELLQALDGVCDDLRPRSLDGGEPLLHIDRCFSLHGAGTIVTGTLARGTLHRGSIVTLAPTRQRARVRALQVHDHAVESAVAGQRVAVNLGGVRHWQVGVGDAIGVTGGETRVLDCELSLTRPASGPLEVIVHHGTRAASGRAVPLDGARLWQLRLRRGLLAGDGDRVVLRGGSPLDTLGGGRVLDAHARRHGGAGAAQRALIGAPAHPSAAASRSPASQEPPPGPTGPSRVEVELEQRLLAAGPALLSRIELAGVEVPLAALRRRGLAVRLRDGHHAHARTIEEVAHVAREHIGRHGSLTLAQLRDALGLSRRPAQALIEHLDQVRVTRRLPDDRRVLSHREAS